MKEWIDWLDTIEAKIKIMKYASSKEYFIASIIMVTSDKNRILTNRQKDYAWKRNLR